MSRSKNPAARARYRAKKQAINAAVMEVLTAAGCNCSNCGGSSARDQWVGKPGQLMCDTHSDFYGMTHVLPTHLCTDWSQKT